MGLKFCTVKQVKDAMLTEDGYAGHDTLITSQIEQATALIQTFTRRDWLLSQYTDIVDTTDIDISIRRGKNTFVATLREKPIDVTEPNYPKLRYNTGGRWDNSSDLDLSTYSVDVRKNQIIMYPSILTSQARSLRIVYTAGYPLDATDTDLVLVKPTLRSACIAQTVYAVRRELNAVSGTNRKDSSERLASYGMNASGLVREALSLIKSDVRLLVGSNG